MLLEFLQNTRNGVSGLSMDETIMFQNHLESIRKCSEVLIMKEKLILTKLGLIFIGVQNELEGRNGYGIVDVRYKHLNENLYRYVEDGIKILSKVYSFNPNMKCSVKQSNNKKEGIYYGKKSRRHHYNEQW